MLILNVGAGDCRIQSPDWLNIDQLRSYFPVDNPEHGYLNSRLDNEPNYVDMDIALPWWPGQHPGETAERFDACVICHVLEHFDVPGALHILREIHRCLKPGGVLRITVPDASYFRRVYPEDRRENWARLFEPFNDTSDNQTYLQVALFFEQHLAVHSEDTMWCMLVMAGFRPDGITRVGPGESRTGNPAGQAMVIMDTRPLFSLHCECVK